MVVGWAGGAPPPAVLAVPAAVVRGGVAEPCAALARPAPGERTISNAEVPLPRSPLSLAAGTAPRRQTETLSRTGAARVQPRGCKGRSPLHKITLSPPPSPEGKGAGGMGAGKQAKVKRQAGNKEGKPPAGYHSGKVGRRQRKQAPRRHLFALPRGRGPSQTPKFLSPGPPSPWLTALPIERLFYRFFA